MDAGIRVEGVDELRASLRRAGADMPKALAAANKGAAGVVVRAAGPDVPVRSGKLRKSLRAVGTTRTGEARAGGAGVPYAAAIHWGRKRGNVGWPPNNHMGRNPITGRPFLWEAAQRTVGGIENVYLKEVMALLAEANRRNAVTDAILNGDV